MVRSDNDLPAVSRPEYEPDVMIPAVDRTPLSPPGRLIIVAVNLPPNSYVSMNMQLERVEADPVRAGAGRRASRGLYLPTIAIAGLATWLSWRGWTVPRRGRFTCAGRT